MKKICSSCLINLELCMFGKHKNGHLGLKSRCRICLSKEENISYYKNRPKIRAAQKLYYLSNRKRLIEDSSNYRIENKEKIVKRIIEWRKRNKPRLLEIRRRTYNFKKDFDYKTLLIKQNYKCNYCGEKKLLGIDHKIPISRGGSDCIRNIVLACSICNSRKSHRTPQEYKNYAQEMGYKIVNSK